MCKSCYLVETVFVWDNAELDTLPSIIIYTLDSMEEAIESTECILLTFCVKGGAWLQRRGGRSLYPEHSN